MPIPPPPNAKKAWQGSIYAAWEWPQELFDGSTATFECITRTDSASVIAFLDPQTVLLSKQEQPGRPPFIDVPGGRVDTGEDHLKACKRELEEETGYQAADPDWELWSIHSSFGGVRFEQSNYLARNVKPTGHVHADPGERIELMPTPWDKVVEMCLRGKLRQTGVMYAILRMQFDPASKQRLTEWLNRA